LRRLKVNYFLCRCNLTVDVFTGSAENKYCFEDEKRVRLMQYCEAGNYDLTESFYYGDSISDFPALDVVGHPVCVEPDRKLTRIARERGWRVCDWQS
jgi:phosphoserine phosphatase